jgi:glutathione S-transferase
MNGGMKLLGRASSINVRKVLWTCAEIGLPVVHEPWGSEGLSLQDPAFLQHNPNAMVPVWLEGDFVLWESNVICRYLATAHGRSDLLPQAPRARAIVEQWMDWQATELNNAWRYAFMALVRRSPAHQDPALIAAGLAGWARHLTILERQLERSAAFVAGDGFTLADVVLGLSVHRWFATPGDKPALPAMAAYYERLNTRAGFRLHGNNGQP